MKPLTTNVKLDEFYLAMLDNIRDAIFEETGMNVNKSDCIKESIFFYSKSFNSSRHSNIMSEKISKILEESE